MMVISVVLSLNTIFWFSHEKVVILEAGIVPDFYTSTTLYSMDANPLLCSDAILGHEQMQSHKINNLAPQNIS